ncbi:long-chain-fatty-acid--CoA ligase [Rhizorhabdus dicambivorans]|uniref:Long-chain fatty acid--CoA ligase n=1 Tax=Rhizorhabdus dicambivorans TaxID=1850238 RepID=A0A2A4FWX7_9SPHN|nr:long-chain fatty acid--CoA ligase [Rhizorhabdus dicambivorans]ATE66934.1 long-chain fatty acid--CoA ligase [Rhizorhabdus dicambivorans]PCE42194.1 long-chain fatty acid--CoA ligase [Rhizorhabdus dicambivorans]
MTSGDTVAPPKSPRRGAASPDGGDVPASPPIPPRLLTDLIDAAVRDHGGRTAIDFLGRTWRYAEIGAMVDRAAAGLQAMGVGPGVRFGLCLPNTPYFVVLYFAALRCGATIVNFNPLYVEHELKHQIRDSGTTVMAVIDVASIHAKIAAIAQESGLEKIIVCPMTEILPPLLSILYRLFKRGEIARPPRDGRHVTFADILAGGDGFRPVPIDPDDVAVLQYTGGTTGVPKGAMLTHANLTANSRQMILHVAGTKAGDPARQDRIMGVLPMFHVFALTTVLNFSIDTAALMILLPRFELKQFLKTAKRTRPTKLLAVPTMLTAINKAAAERPIHFDDLDFCVSGGAPLPFDVRAEFERLTGARVVEGYGLSETSPILTCNPCEGEVKDNSAGPAFPGTIIEIRSLEDPHQLMPVGQRGEVCARGPQVMKGYWNKPEETAKVFVDGAIRTGDVGYLDEDGYLFLVDRIKDVIICGGYNVYPRVIEEALYEHPAVLEAVVIGVADAYRGQAPKAFVVLRPGQQASIDDLSEFLKTRVSKIEMPREIEIRTSLPKTLIGKLSKKELVAEEARKASPAS